MIAAVTVIVIHTDTLLHICFYSTTLYNYILYFCSHKVSNVWESWIVCTVVLNESTEPRSNY